MYVRLTSSHVSVLRRIRGVRLIRHGFGTYEITGHRLAIARAITYVGRIDNSLPADDRSVVLS